ncbi:MAG: glycosyltransferase family 39 protein [Nanoarchaeota archaeon]|nr:glycosyltransferase family 39 protein [Nanoarchaeota archaeon]
MKINKKYLEIFAITILYLSALYIWTLPIHNNRLPFGDVDASSHFAIGDYMSMHGSSIAKIPEYVGIRYGGQNEMFPWALWYPPQYWTNAGIMQLIGGDRILSFFIMIAIFCSLFILSSYFLIRSLFGFWPAFLSSLLLIFSVRDYMVYLFGQWPQSLGYAFTPLILYCYYKYADSILNKEKKTVYIYIMSLLLVIQSLMHPQGFIASAGTMVIFTGLLLIREKKLPFNFKHLFIILAIFFVVSILLAPLNMGEFFGEIFKTGGERESWNLGILFSWYQDSSKFQGLPAFYFYYNTSHGDINGSKLGYWTLPLLFIGVIVVFLNGFILKKDRKNILLFSWLIAFYLLTHLAAFGMGGRDQRMMAFEAHVIYPIIAIGLLSIPSFFKLNNFVNKIAKYSLIIIFIVFALAVNGKSTIGMLNMQQYSISRINPYQYEVSEWVLKNLPEDAYIYDIGTFGYQYYGAKVKWLSVLSQRPFVLENRMVNMSDYIMLDYSDLALLRKEEEVNNLRKFESENFGDATPVYNKELIKVYEVGNFKAE